MKKRILFAAVALCALLSLMACGELQKPASVKLGTPALTVTGFTVSWGAVEHAGAYKVRVNEGTWGAEQTALTYTLAETAPGIYTVRVKAVSGSEGYTDGDEAVSENIVITTRLPAPVLSLTDATVTWPAVPDATAYKVKTGGGAWGAEQTARTFTVTEPGTHTVTVIAVSNSPVYTDSPEASKAVVVKRTMAAPVLTLDNKTVEWTAVAGAEGYKISVNGGAFGAAQTALSYTLTETAAGSYIVEVKAVTSDAEYFAESAPASQTIEVYAQLAAPAPSASGESAEWVVVEHAAGYQVKVDDGAWGAVQTDRTYSLAAAEGTHTVFVKAVAPGTYYTESGEGSASVTVAFKLNFKSSYGVNNSVAAQTVLPADFGQIFDTNSANPVSTSITPVSVKKNGAAFTPSGAITVGGGEFYEFVVTAANSVTSGTASRYFTVKANDCHIMTFDGMTAGTEPAGTWVANNSGGVAVDDLGYGNLALKFAGVSGAWSCAFEPGITLPDGYYRIDFALRFENASGVFFLHTGDSQAGGSSNPILGAVSEGMLTINDAWANDGLYGFQLYNGDKGQVWIDWILFTPVAEPVNPTDYGDYVYRGSAGAAQAAAVSISEADLAAYTNFANASDGDSFTIAYSVVVGKNDGSDVDSNAVRRYDIFDSANTGYATGINGAMYGGFTSIVAPAIGVPVTYTQTYIYSGESGAKFFLWAFDFAADEFMAITITSIVKNV